ncbi:putative metallophosphoesterase YhaO [Planctomycetes bacterium Poly30]|uniref:Putative metallophosphoesterase YhaO n=1 Tax=Saltatorellus ferox TaxID=2528018 RepID=A0A518F0P2_9BACT|nr:putative metallophosphoesterase YhaO [Planctomycetes bacterium Poly30]
MTFRFLHLADLHLDSAYGGTRETADRLRQASLDALVAAANLAIEAEVDAALIAGDAFDDERLGYAARSVFRRELERLAEHGITVLHVTGNHDPGTSSGRAAALRLVGGPGSTSRSAPIHTILDGTPRVFEIRNRAREVVGQVIAAGHATSRVTDNLVHAMRAKLEAAPLDAALPRIGLLHTQVGSAAGADGHQPYAPCSVADLMACDLDYWALGHVHVRGRVDPAIPAYYAGNLQGRNAREAGPKGGLLVEVDRDGMESEPEFVALAPVEFFRCRGELAKEAEPERAAEAIASALDAAAAEGNGPEAREIVVRFDHAGPAAPEGFALAVREELQRMSGPHFGEFLEVELAPDRTAVERLSHGPSEFDRSRELLARIERTPSALREALAVCREHDDGAALRLEDALLGRLLHGSDG